MSIISKTTSQFISFIFIGLLSLVSVSCSDDKDVFQEGCSLNCTRVRRTRSRKLLVRVIIGLII